MVKKNLNAEFPQIESGQLEAAAACVCFILYTQTVSNICSGNFFWRLMLCNGFDLQEVTFKQDHDDSNDNSQSPNYDDDDDEPQDYTMEDEEVSGFIKL